MFSWLGVQFEGQVVRATFWSGAANKQIQSMRYLATAATDGIVKVSFRRLVHASRYGLFWAQIKYAAGSGCISLEISRVWKGFYPVMRSSRGPNVASSAWAWLAPVYE